MTTPAYVFGHSQAELDRLVWQAKVLRPFTERLLTTVGLRPDMRVLDIGCGAGDVAMLAAELVGPDGFVLGIDRNGDAVALAQARALSAGLSNMGCQQVAIEDFDTVAPFDLVVGRYVLAHQPDPAAFLRYAARHVRPGGVLALHEVSFVGRAPSVPLVPLWQQAVDWTYSAMRSVTSQLDAGSRLIEHFAAAGLPEPHLRCEVPVGGGPDSTLYRWLADAVRTLLPIIEQLGVSADVVDVDTLEARLRKEIVAAHSQIEWLPQFLAWATI